MYRVCCFVQIDVSDVVKKNLHRAEKEPNSGICQEQGQ